MKTFAWQRRRTRHFGKQRGPFAELDVRSTDRRWRRFLMQIDTGAVISVLPCSAATLIGIQPDSGEPVEMSGISGPARRYHVHPLIARIGEGAEFPMRIAIAEREDAPNLLGRLDIMESFRLVFDPIKELSLISRSNLASE